MNYQKDEPKALSRSPTEFRGHEQPEIAMLVEAQGALIKEALQTAGELGVHMNPVLKQNMEPIGKGDSGTGWKASSPLGMMLASNNVELATLVSNLRALIVSCAL